MRALRVGIIGCGVIGPTHAACYRQVPGVTMTWACDLIQERAAKLAAAHNIPRTTTDVKRLLRADDVDAVSVCTDHASHARLVAAALKAGKHVLCEKALAQKSSGLETILAASAARPDLVCSGVFQHRFETLNRRVRDLIAAGGLGRMLTAGFRLRCQRTDDYYRADAWRGTWDQEGGSVLINQAIHHLDLLRWMMGGARMVTGVHANLTHGATIETEDTAAAAVVFANGALGTIEATCSSHATWESSLFFQGATGAIEIFNDAVRRVDLADKTAGERLLEELSGCAGAHVDGPGKSYYGIGHPAQIADFIGAIRERRAPFVTAPSSAETVDLVLGVYKSYRTGRRVALPARTGA